MGLLVAGTRATGTTGGQSPEYLLFSDGHYISSFPYQPRGFSHSLEVIKIGDPKRFLKWKAFWTNTHHLPKPHQHPSRCVSAPSRLKPGRVIYQYWTLSYVKPPAWPNLTPR